MTLDPQAANRYPPVQTARRVAECLGDPAECARDVVECLGDPLACTYAQRAPLTIELERLFREHSTGDVVDLGGGITLIKNCRGLCELVPAPAFTVGHTIFTTGPDINPDTLREEKNHVTQYELLGDGFWMIYGASGVASAIGCLASGGDYGRCLHDSNILEILARP